MTERRAAVLEAFRKQIAWCERLGSPFTARLLGLLAEDLAAGGPAADLAGHWPGDPVADALALRLAGALHALVLSGEAPALAACYPPRANARADAPDAAALRAVLLARRAEIAAFLASPPQTNEVGRSGVLLGGFLEIAHRAGLPLRLLEIGASAGLNLLWDRFHYTLGDAVWGDPASPVRLAPRWTGPLPPLAAPVRVASRGACDRSPVDLRDPAQRLRLRAYVWPDQQDRLARLDGAIALALGAGSRVEPADAGDWVAARLAEPAEGQATVLYHSIMWQYMPAATRARIAGALSEAGARATAAAPLAWLRFEPPQAEARPELRLTLWPGGGESLLATAQAHGQTVDWTGG
ncbi:DUF2332 domain-containing protein [Pseudoroseomonas sp. WGS1072]|uniref:DUF2332 domain-containing protein n=1 Tax=Roseomonas sp. WGS1072 TaxID=3366816 RepID=UPI003BEF72D0